MALYIYPLFSPGATFANEKKQYIDVKNHKMTTKPFQPAKPANRIFTLDFSTLCRCILLHACILLTVVNVRAQKTIRPTESISISGEIKKERTYTIADLLSLPALQLKDLVIYNHKGEIKDTLTGLMGIPLKSLFVASDFNVEQPKDLNEFYLVCIASDNYKVVFSWNEIFNSMTGDHVFLISHVKGQNMEQMPQRIACITTGDAISGRRYIKGLTRIEVKRVH